MINSVAEAACQPSSDLSQNLAVKVTLEAYVDLRVQSDADSARLAQVLGGQSAACCRRWKE